MKQKCPDCGGSGQKKYHLNPMDIGEPDYQPVYDFKRCKTCKGKRKIRKNNKNN